MLCILEGTAEDCAQRIAHEAARRHYANVAVMSCDEYSMQNIFEDSFFLFVIATTGQGDQPDNMKSFFRGILKKQLLPGDFRLVHSSGSTIFRQEPPAVNL